MTPKPAARKAVPPPHPDTPDHRWLRAHMIVGDYDSGRRIDRPTLYAVEFLQRHLAQRLIPSDSPMSAALTLYRDSEPIAWKLEALLLARGQSGSSIAHRLKLPFPVVKLYRSIFYDARSWRRRRVSGLALYNGDPMLGLREEDLETLWKWVAYYWGIEGLDRVLAVTTGDGRERYSEAALDDAALFVETARIPILGKFRQFQQLVNRSEAEDAGLPPSVYHLRRKDRQGIPLPSSWDLHSSSLNNPGAPRTP